MRYCEIEFQKEEKYVANGFLFIKENEQISFYFFKREVTQSQCCPSAQ